MTEKSIKIILDQELVMIVITTWGSVHLGVHLDHLTVNFIVFDQDEHSINGISEVLICPVTWVHGADVEYLASASQDPKKLALSDISEWNKRYRQIMRNQNRSWR